MSDEWWAERAASGELGPAITTGELRPANYERRITNGELRMTNDERARASHATASIAPTMVGVQTVKPLGSLAPFGTMMMPLRM
jgi:hypothetical protein